MIWLPSNEQSVDCRFGRTVMSFVYHRRIHFRDTDAAGVVYFANILSMCHEAYEASLEAAGINLGTFFCYPRIAIPITHSTIDFMRPLFCGDEIRVYASPKKIKDGEFEVAYEVFAVERVSRDVPEIQETLAARAFTKHVCIDSSARIKTFIPDEVMRWMAQWGGESQQAAIDADILL